MNKVKKFCDINEIPYTELGNHLRIEVGKYLLCIETLGKNKFTIVKKLYKTFEDCSPVIKCRTQDELVNWVDKTYLSEFC